MFGILQSSWLNKGISLYEHLKSLSFKDEDIIKSTNSKLNGTYNIKNSIKKGILDKETVIESLVSFKRSGAAAIVTYFALEIAKKI